MRAAQAQLEQSEINLGYTDIRAPISGKIGRTAVTVGNVVSPEFRRARHHRQPGPDVRGLSGRGAHRARAAHRTAGKGGFRAVVIKIRLPDGRTYDQTGTLDFVDNTVAAGTDTIILRGVDRQPACCHDAKSDLTERGWSTASWSP